MIPIAIIDAFPAEAIVIMVLWFLGWVATVPLLICLAFRKTRRVSAWLLAVDLLGLSGIHLATSIGTSGKNLSPRSVCENQLRLIGLDCLVYANDHGNAFPASFTSLKNIAQQTRLFVCRLSKATPGSVETIDHWTDYVLVTNLTAASGPVLVLAYCKPENHRHGTAVLFVDGSVTWVETEDFGRLPCDLINHSRINREPQPSAAPLPSAPSGPSEGAR